MSQEEGNFWVDEEKEELVLEDQDGEERFYIDEEFNYEGTTYLILIPAEEKEDNNEDEALLLKLIKEDGEEMIALIEDDDEFEKVKNYYMQR